MKEVIYNKFGNIDVLEMHETEMFNLNTGEVAVQVKAVSINPLDWKIRKGEMKLMTGSKFPKRTGIDFAGVVTQTGNDTGNFKVGDEVFGAINAMKKGALGDIVAAPVKTLWKKPANISFSQAASIPIVGCGAHLAMIDIAKAGPGKEILLNGATGGMGMFALQLAKQKGAMVTAVTGSDAVSYAEVWGADNVIDYTKQNVLLLGKKYDAIFDLSGRMPFDKAKAILKPKAVFINPVPVPIQIITTAITNLFTSQKNKVLLSNTNDRAIQDILMAIDKGLEIVVSKTFMLDDFYNAYQYAEKGGYLGKLAIEVQ